MPPADPEAIWDSADRLNAQPVPGVRLTERQSVAWCPPEEIAEWVDGEIILVPTETPGHNDRGNFLGGVVREFVEHHDLGRVITGTVRLLGR